jgi:hypothetical protein
MKTRTGKAFMTLFNSWYYSYSPTFASYVSNHQTQRAMFRYGLYPLIGLLYASYYAYMLVSPFNPELAALTSGIVAAGLIGLIYVAVPLYLVKRILKRKVIASSWSKAARVLTCSAISGVAIVVSYYAGTELTLGAAATCMILSALTFGAYLGDLALTRIEFMHPAQNLVLIRVLKTWNRVDPHPA